MRRIETTIEYFLGVKGRCTLLRRICGNTEGRLWMRELGRRAGLGMSGLYREVRILEALGLIRRTYEAQTCFIEIDRGHPLFGPLSHLVKASEELDAEIRRSGREWPNRTARPGPRRRGVLPTSPGFIRSGGRP